MERPIAGLRLNATPPNEPTQQIEVQIGLPVQVGPDEWVCPVELKGLYESMQLRGGDALQALGLAMRLSLSLLKAFKDGGGTLQYVPSEHRADPPGSLDIPLEAYGLSLMDLSARPDRPA